MTVLKLQASSQHVPRTKYTAMIQGIADRASVDVAIFETDMGRIELCGHSATEIESIERDIPHHRGRQPTFRRVS